MTQGIVTPEAVVLEFPTGGVGTRVLAALVDLAIRVVLLVVMLIGTGFIGRVVPQVGLAGEYVALFTVAFGYPIAFETWWHGRTPGKAAFALRVVTVEGAPERFRQAAIRAFLGVIDFFLTLGGGAVICIFLSPRDQRLGDMVGGTLVIRERTGAVSPAPATFIVPYGYEQYAATLDVSGLTPADYAAARSFLLRAGSLDPHRRHDLAAQIATPLLGRLRHSPPPWVSPEALLACVAALYQGRQRSFTPVARAPEPQVPPPPPGPPGGGTEPVGGYVPPA